MLCLPLFPMWMFCWLVGCSLPHVVDLEGAHNCKNWMCMLHLVLAEVVLGLTTRSFLYVGEYNMYWAVHGGISYAYLMFRLRSTFGRSNLQSVVAAVLVLVLFGWHYRFDFMQLSEVTALVDVDYYGMYERFDPYSAYHTAYSGSYGAVEAALAYDYANSEHRYRRDTLLNWAILVLVTVCSLQVLMESLRCVLVSMFKCLFCSCCRSKMEPFTKDEPYVSDGSEDEGGVVDKEASVSDGPRGLTALEPMQRVPSVFLCAEHPQLGPEMGIDYEVCSVFAFVPKGPPTPENEYAPESLSSPPIDYDVPSVFNFIPGPPVYEIDYDVPSVFTFIPTARTDADEEVVEEFEAGGEGLMDLVSVITDEAAEEDREEESETSVAEVRPPTPEPEPEPEPEPPTPAEIKQYFVMAEAEVVRLKTLRQTAVASVYKAQQVLVQLFAADCFDLCDRMKAHLSEMRAFQEEMRDAASCGNQVAHRLWLAQHSAPPKRARQVRADFVALQESTDVATEKGARLERVLAVLSTEASVALDENIEHVEILRSIHEAPASALVVVEEPTVSLVVHGTSSKEPVGAVGPDGQVARLQLEPITDLGGTWNKVRLPKMIYGAHTVKPPPKLREEIEQAALLAHKASVTGEIMELLEARRIVEQAAADKEAAYIARFGRKPGHYK